MAVSTSHEGGSPMKFDEHAFSLLLLVFKNTYLYSLNVANVRRKTNPNLSHAESMRKETKVAQQSREAHT